MPAVTANLKRLLTGCRHIRAARQRHEADAVRGLMKRMRAKMPQIISRMREYDRFHATSFNVFRAVGIERKEAIFHTPFLAFLLNPEATHGQGFLFLTAFFDVLRGRKDFVAPRFKIDSAAWQVDSEMPAGQGGIIDLLIECPTNGYVLVLENKIDAAEGDDQLWRYARWIEHSRPQHRTRQVVFLTPEGRAPVSH
jgi:PD-(D/E)XK nuclease superfamily